MTSTQQRTLTRLLPVLPLLVAGTLLTACSGGSGSSDASSGAASASSSGGAHPASADPQDKALAFAKCMRKNGVPNFPDPGQGGFMVSSGSGIDPNSAGFKTAQQACQDLAPQGLGGGGGTLDSAKVAAWAKCIRENGLPKFADPAVSGSNMSLDFTGTGIDPQGLAFQKAMQACQSKWPGGGISITGGGSQ